MVGEVRLDTTIRFRPCQDVLVDFIRFAFDASLPGSTPACIEAISEGSDQGSGSSDSIQEPHNMLLTPAGLKWIYQERKRLPEFCLARGIEVLRFHQLVERGCQMVLPEPQFPPRDPVLEARIQKLKAQQANREYRQMTMNVDGRSGLRKHGLDDPINLQMKELNNYLFLMLQFAISIVVGFLSGYFAPLFFAGISDTGTRIIYGILVAFITGVADLYFIMKFLLETEGLIENGNLSFFDPPVAKKNA